MAGFRLGMVAGEASGDLLAASVLDGLSARADALDARGIGGPRMRQRGFDAWWTIDALSVNGYIEVLREYPRLKRMRDALRERLIAWRPDVFVGVDAPDFNLDLEIALRERGIRTVHFIGPSIWAWRAGRIERIRRAVDHVLLIFPFEEEIYRKAGIPATYVGHPLADRIPERVDTEAARRALTRHLKRAGKVWIRIFPDVPVSTKPAEVRMGSGKGAPEYWVCRVHPGRIMFEVDGVRREEAKRAFELAAAKLPIKSRFIARLGEGA